MKPRVALKKLLLLFLATVISFSSVQADVVNAALSPEQKAIYNKGIYYFDREEVLCIKESEGSTATGGDVDRFLQALASQESGGDPRAESSVSSASGKYQYIDGTWRARYEMYPPARDYARAKDAPEAVQDAVAYIEYSTKFEQLGNDLFKLAVSHFYPAANSDPSLLDIKPGNNSITPREYAESILSKIEEGVGSNIHLLYRQAPEFDRYNTASSGPSDSPTNPTGPSNPSAPTNKGTVFIDPGHGAAIAEYTDRISGLRDRETANSPESSDVLDVARQVKAALESEGYTVKLSRNDNTTKVTKRERVEAAKRANANIAVSLHTTPGSEVNDVWYQRDGAYREYNGTRVTFDNKEVADLSHEYAEIIAQARSQSESRSVNTDSSGAHQEAAFNRAGVPSKGNISLLQLWSESIPWVYSEYALGNDTGLNASGKQKYASGIVDGIRKVFEEQEQATVDPANISPEGVCKEDNDAGSDFAGGDITETVLAYAWPEYHSPNYLQMMPAYATAVRKAQREGRYVGGGTHPGVDCGGFVTLLLTDSGFEPEYNHSGRGGNTVTQRAWAEANWKTLGSGSDIDVSDLQPGDVAFSPGHTFVFVGDIQGFGSNIASASYSPSNTKWRSPMAGEESLTASDVTWYGKR